MKKKINTIVARIMTSPLTLGGFIEFELYNLRGIAKSLLTIILMCNRLVQLRQKRFARHFNKFIREL